MFSITSLCSLLILISAARRVAKLGRFRHEVFGASWNVKDIAPYNSSQKAKRNHFALSPCAPLLSSSLIIAFCSAKGDGDAFYFTIDDLFSDIFPRSYVSEHLNFLTTNACRTIKQEKNKLILLFSVQRVNLWAENFFLPLLCLPFPRPRDDIFYVGPDKWHRKF